MLRVILSYSWAPSSLWLGAWLSQCEKITQTARWITWLELCLTRLCHVTLPFLSHFYAHMHIQTTEKMHPWKKKDTVKCLTCSCVGERVWMIRLCRLSFSVECDFRSSILSFFFLHFAYIKDVNNLWSHTEQWILHLYNSLSSPPVCLWVNNQTHSHTSLIYSVRDDSRCAAVWVCSSNLWTDFWASYK